MSKFFRAVLIAAAATGAAALLLRTLDLDDEAAATPSGSGFGGLDPDELSEEEVDVLMQELANQLGL